MDNDNYKCDKDGNALALRSFFHLKTFNNWKHKLLSNLSRKNIYIFELDSDLDKTINFTLMFLNQISG